MSADSCKNNPCELHRSGHYKKWPCSVNGYDRQERHNTFVQKKEPCKHCGELKTKYSETCKKCIYKTKTHHLKGTKLPEWWKQRITNKFQCGEKHPNWKGGKTPQNKKWRMCKEFRDWRMSVFTRDNFTCQECLVRGGELHPHHLKPMSLFPELRYELNNGITLCASCHRKTPSWGNGLNNMTREEFLSKNWSKSCWSV